eukprot:scaffold26051_cov82-Isochrysis_galbana.AAC.2
MASYRTAIRHDERHYNAWYGLGNVYFRQEKFDFAEHHFRKRVSSLAARTAGRACHDKSGRVTAGPGVLRRYPPPPQARAPGGWGGKVEVRPTGDCNPDLPSLLASLHPCAAIRTRQPPTLKPVAPKPLLT